MTFIRNFDGQKIDKKRSYNLMDLSHKNRINSFDISFQHYSYKSIFKNEPKNKYLKKDAERTVKQKLFGIMKKKSLIIKTNTNFNQRKSSIDPTYSNNQFNKTMKILNNNNSLRYKGNSQTLNIPEKN